MMSLGPSVISMHRRWRTRLWLRSGGSDCSVCFGSYSGLQPTAQDPELRGGTRSGPHQREDAASPRQQSARSRSLSQQPAVQHRAPRQERHHQPGLKAPPLPSLPIFSPSSTSPCPLASFPPPILSPLRAGEEGSSVRVTLATLNLFYHLMKYHSLRLNSQRISKVDLLQAITAQCCPGRHLLLGV